MRVVKIWLRGFDAERILADFAQEYEVPIERLPRPWWQYAPTRQITVPYPGDDAYRLLQSRAAVRLGAMSSTSLRIWTEG